MDEQTANSAKSTGNVEKSLGKRIGSVLFKGLAVGFFLGLIITVAVLIPLAVAIFFVDKGWLYAMSKNAVFYLRALLLFFQATSAFFAILYFARKEFFKRKLKTVR